ncbi:hypothetical protein HOC01_04305 [archaeon]|jgi:hypothetical protein|nr:hypothetical protein [archaeon]MBT6698366.1 hypothetical protein [archaeon]
MSSKVTFPHIKLENKNYPSVIMGEDHFTGWFKKCKKYDSEKQRANAYQETLEMAYSKGVRGFSISPHATLVKVLKNFKKKHPRIVCISNHHWKSHYYIDDESLWSPKNMQRLGASESFYHKNIESCKWFDNQKTTNRFSEKEINEFRLDEKEYKKQLKKMDFCDFALVGNIGRSALILLNRADIVEKEIELVRQQKIIPIGMCEGGALALPKMEKLNTAGTWVWMNKHFCCPNLKSALKTIKKSTKPITSYRVFVSLDGFDLEKSISFIKKIKQVKSIVVGVDGVDQAKQTFTNLHKHWR